MGKNDVFNIDDELREDPWSEIRWMRRFYFGSIVLYFGSFMVVSSIVGPGKHEPIFVTWLITGGIILLTSLRLHQLKCPICKKNFVQNRRLSFFSHCGYCKAKIGAEIPPPDEPSTS